MRGSPLLRALLTLAMLLLAAWPVWRITHAGAANPVKTPAPPTSVPVSAPARLQLEFLPAPPLEFTVTYLGKPIWRGGGKSSDDSPPLDIRMPAEGVDLQFSARWPAEITSAALRARLTAPDGATIERQAWTRENSSLDQVLTFQAR